MKGRIAVAGLLAALAAAPPALAADAEVRGGRRRRRATSNRWEPARRRPCNAGDTVTWRFDDAGAPHNVKSTTHELDDVDARPPAVGPPPATYTFAAEGTYRSAATCTRHMSGSSRRSATRRRLPRRR